MVVCSWSSYYKLLWQTVAIIRKFLSGYHRETHGDWIEVNFHRNIVTFGCNLVKYYIPVCIIRLHDLYEIYYLYICISLICSRSMYIEY